MHFVFICICAAIFCLLTLLFLTGLFVRQTPENNKENRLDRVLTTDMDLLMNDISSLYIVTSVFKRYTNPRLDISLKYLGCE